MPRPLVGIIILALVGGTAFALSRMRPEDQTPRSSRLSGEETLRPPRASGSFWYVFNADGALDESGSPEESGSRYWWLNSGGRMIISDLTGETMQGDASRGDPWYREYARTNPTDTDGGLHPQNIFRLVTRSSWGNASVRALFYIAADEFSRSPNRNESNGLLLMSRYQDQGQTLYYAGIRVDGTAVIKKKYKGTYYTMAQETVFPGVYRGDQDEVNLLPHAQWIPLKSDTVTDGTSVVVTLFMRRPGDKDWQQLLTATDSGGYEGTPPLTGPARVGIRTDFMDVRFRTFVIEPL